MLQDAAMQDAHTAEPVTIGPRSSIAELRRLNQERWERQLAEEEAPTASVQGGGDSAPVAAPPPPLPNKKINFCDLRNQFFAFVVCILRS